MIVRQFAGFPGGCQVDDALVQVDALNGGLDEPSGAQKSADWNGAGPQVQNARKDLEQQRRHEHEVVPAHQNDFNVRPPTKESFQVAGSGDTAKTAAENQDAFF